MKLNECFTEAASYWERKRIPYNAALCLLALICWGPDIIIGGPQDWLMGSMILLVLAAVANALYCLAYPVDILFQLSPLKREWTEVRWILFVMGLSIASGFALWLMLGEGMA